MSGIGEIFLSATLEALIQQLGSAAIKFVTSRKRVKASFVKLSGSLAHIKGVLQDAEEKQYAEASVKQWLVSLRDAAYDLEDLLDEIKTKAEEHSRKVSIFSFKTFRKMSFNHKMMSEIDDINNRLKDIEEQRTALKLGSVNSGGSLGKRKDVTSASKPHMLEDELVVGRDEKKKEIVKMLFQSEVDLLVLPIYGMGGIGKTTLAKAVYYDAKVQEKFGFKAMACVSTEFNDLEVTRKIYRAVMNKEPKSKDLDTLQRDLQTALSNKKFLIVLDDIWNEKSEDWENLICPFKKGQPGSIIIVTTRSENVARMVNPNFEAFFCLESLNEADCLSIMFHHAGIYSFDDKQKFEAVGKELSKRCGGLPLAARALGGILVTKREVDEWERVLDNGIWKLENANIMNVLRLSYFDLPPYLKRMFAYCSIFPQDYEFSKKELVLLWMGEGFLDQHPNKQNKQSKEEWGAECFDELLKKSFFQKSFYGYSCLGRLEEFFVMHDLINDLARLISAEICDRWDTENSLEKVRHCSILPQQFEKLKYFPEAKRLRSLVFLVQNYYDWSRSNKFLQDLLPKLRHIRVLSLRNCRFGELPDSICELTHLRYLDLSNSSITTLPNSLDRLIWLEMLSINGCDKISKLPETLGNLRYLRHLDNSWTWGCIPCEIGRLEHLQTLPKVVLSKKGGFGMKELGNLKHLGGSLTIGGLKNVISIEDIEGCLRDKKKLQELELQWYGGNQSTSKISEEDVLECLRPPNDLRKLEIIHFQGSRFSSWVGDRSYTKLSNISLKDCSCECLPPLGQLPNLQRLEISGMCNITCIGDEFYGHGATCIPFSKLESLSLCYMPNLKKWSSSGTGEGHVFPHLRELKIEGCGKLDDVSPLFLESLRSLTLRSCSVVVLQRFRALGPLTHFMTEHISGLFHLPCKLAQSFSSLEKLKIQFCEELESLLPEDTTLEHLTHLKTIEIYYCDKFRFFGYGNQHLPCNLQELKLYGCPALISLPGDLSRLNSCTKLCIKGCPNLVIFPENGIPPRLKELTLESSNGLESLLSNITRLETLSLQKCSSLRYWEMEISGFQHLVDLTIDNCDTIEHLHSLPPNLIRLKISSCATLRFLPSHILSPMESLEIVDCTQLENFPGFVFPPNLSMLYVRDSGKLKPLNEWGLGRLRYLESFDICGGFPELHQLSDDGDTCLFPTSLIQLSIEEFPMLVSLGNALENLSSLRRLTFRNCYKLGELPSERVLQNLHDIFIDESPNLKIKYTKGIRDYLENNVGIPRVGIRLIY